MIKRVVLEERERAQLSSYAVLSAKSKGRAHREKEHEFRTVFQRDRDRIVHSTAFRRLEYKTQVFVNHEGDHYRTRLTHTLETSQIARTVGRILGLNEDLIEAIALAHDLGHGPFGHAGEWALAKVMEKRGGFEHNRQCLRIVEELEDSYSDFPGLNLTFEVREGLKKHVKNRWESIEAQVVDVADEIAYNAHDLDDGIRAGLLDAQSLARIQLWRDIDRYIKGRFKRSNTVQATRLAIRLLINRMVSDLSRQTEQNIKRRRLTSQADLKRLDSSVACFSKPVAKQVKELKVFLRDNLYFHHRVVRMTEKGQRFIKELFRVYVENPKQLPPHVLRRSQEDGLYRAVCDYIAGMTDRYAADEYMRFFQPYERV